MSRFDSSVNAVRGERDATAVNRPPSIQSRISNLLAIGLMSLLGLGMLIWYYANTITRQSRARQHAQTASINRAQGDMPLPSLGRIDPPPPPPPPASALDSTPWAPPDSPASPVLTPTTLREIPLRPAKRRGRTAHRSPRPPSS